MLDEQIPLVHKGRYVRDQTPEILLLKYIYVHKFTVFKNAERYHVEHIIPVNKLKTLLNNHNNDEKNDEKMAINMISNLALLDPSRNIKKGDLTFHEYLKKQRKTGEITDSEYETQLRDFEEHELLCEADQLPTELSKGTYDDFLQSRFDRLKREFICNWSAHDHIPNAPST